MSGILQGLLASVGAPAGPWLYAWGYNDRGNLGDNTKVYRSSPVQIGSETTWSQVSGGNNSAAAIKADGTLWAWGNNANGQLGDNTIINKSSPVQVGALTDWSQVSAGGNFCAGIRTNGTLWTWGFSGQGRLGRPTLNYNSSPIQVGSLTNWSKIDCSTSGFAASIKTDGTLWTWGYNPWGNLGDGTVVYRSSPVQVGALTTWSQVNCGANHIAAIKTDGTLWVWGRNLFGELGINQGYSSYRSSPVQVGALTNWSQVACGTFLTIAIKTDGTLWSWGSNSVGQLGDNTTVNKSSPVQVGALADWSKLSTGNQFSTAIKTNGTLWTWGGNPNGQLGDSTQSDKSSPIQIGSNSWATVSAGSAFVLAIED